jgi:hypothetical protein
MKTELPFPISFANPTAKGHLNTAGLFHTPEGSLLHSSLTDGTVNQVFSLSVSWTAN